MKLLVDLDRPHYLILVLLHYPPVINLLLSPLWGAAMVVMGVKVREEDVVEDVIIIRSFFRKRIMSPNPFPPPFSTTRVVFILEEEYSHLVSLQSQSLAPSSTGLDRYCHCLSRHSRTLHH